MGLKKKILIILLKAWFYEHMSLLSFLAGGMLTLNYTKTQILGYLNKYFWREVNGHLYCIFLYNVCFKIVFKIFLLIFGLQKIYQRYHRCSFFHIYPVWGLLSFLNPLIWEIFSLLSSRTLITQRLEFFILPHSSVNPCSNLFLFSSQSFSSLFFRMDKF